MPPESGNTENNDGSGSWVWTQLDPRWAGVFAALAVAIIAIRAGTALMACFYPNLKFADDAGAALDKCTLFAFVGAGVIPAAIGLAHLGGANR